MAELRTILSDDTPFILDDDENISFANLLGNFGNADHDLRETMEEAESALFVDDSIRNEINLSPSEIQRITHDVMNSDEILQTFEEIDLSEVEKMGCEADDLQQFLYSLDVTCEDCISYEKVTAIAQIKPGDHIRIHRKAIGINWYNHHAIVTDIDLSRGEVTLVHFQKHMGKFTVIKESKKFDKSESIDKIRYQSRPFTAEEIVERANKMAEKFANNQHEEAYSLPNNNCEGKSNEIASGVKFSQQVASKMKYIKSTVTWLLKLLLKGAIKFLENVKPFVRGVAHVSVIASLLSMVDQIQHLKYKLKQGILCLKCYDREHKKLMASLIFCLITVGISVMTHVSWFYFGVCTAIALALPFVSSFVVNTVMPIIQPAANIPKPSVLRESMIRKGDVITFPYVGLYHEGVITSVSSLPVDQSDVIKVTLVHFNYPGLFGTRTVVKEVFFFNVKTQNIYVYDFNQQNTYSPEEVVARALEKVGSQNFNTFSNRSSHLSRYCKTGQPTLNTLPVKRVSKMTDISPGDVINFSYCWLPHDAVVVQVQYPGTIQCGVIHYNYAGLTGTRSVVEETFTFKLADQNVFVHDYAGYDVYEPDEVVRRARSRLGEQKFNTFTNRSSHLAKWCKMKRNT